MTNAFYITTPIYYVNDRPHIGHIYTTTVADIVARAQRLAGEDVFFLTGTDEHAAKVLDSAAERGLPPLAWADQNAAVFQQTFARLGISNDDFIRTTERRHTERVQNYIKALVASGDVYPGRYEGWYDAGQEEYVTDARAEEFAFTSPVNGRPLVRKSEDNYFFRLSRYTAPLLRLLEARPDFVQPEARRNEVLGRLREGLNDVPVSRTGAAWGVPWPGQEGHRVYVWFDALFNYLSVVDTSARRHYWPADVHLIGKEILWFHAVIWPALLMALGQQPGYGWAALPRRIYAHGFWISGGQKMSKSLGNFIGLEQIEGYVERLGLDALRYFLARYGPIGATDHDFTEARLLGTYSSDLANGFGNFVHRAAALVSRYTGGIVPAPGALAEPDARLRAQANALPGKVATAIGRLAVDDAIAAVMDLVASANRYTEETAPWQLAQAGNQERLATVLYHVTACARLAAWHLAPVMPSVAAAAHRRLCGQEPAPGAGTFDWLRPAAPVTPGAPLLPRLEVRT